MNLIRATALKITNMPINAALICTDYAPFLDHAKSIFDIFRFAFASPDLIGSPSQVARIGGGCLIRYLTSLILIRGLSPLGHQ